MSDLFLMLSFAGVLLALFSLYALISFVKAKHMCSVSIQEQKTIIEIIKLSSQIHKNQARLKNSPAIERYLRGAMTISARYNSCRNGIKVERFHMFEDERMQLIKEVKDAPREVQKIVIQYNHILGELYRCKYPIRTFLSKCKMKIAICFLRCLIALLDMRRNQITAKDKKNEVIKVNNVLKAHDAPMIRVA